MQTYIRDINKKNTSKLKNKMREIWFRPDIMDAP